MVDDDIKVVRLVDEVELLGAQSQHRAEVEGGEPLAVEGIEQGQLVGGDTGFDRPRSLANALHQHRHGRGQINEQVGPG